MFHCHVSFRGSNSQQNGSPSNIPSIPKPIFGGLRVSFGPWALRGEHQTTLPKTKASKNGCLEYDPFLLGFGLFSGAFAVSFREDMSPQIPTTTPIHDAIFSRRFFPAMSRCHCPRNTTEVQSAMSSVLPSGKHSDRWNDIPMVS